MNFQKIPPVERGKFYVELAFSKARIKGQQKNLTGNWLQIIRKKECLKIDIIKDTIASKLDALVKNFPSIDHLPFFYVLLLKSTLDFVEFKKSLGSLTWARKKILDLQRIYVSKIMGTTTRGDIKKHSKEFYGRISSVMKQIDKNLVFLENSRKLMKTYPDIKEMFTVAIYGFPNIGKTTFLNKLTGTTAKIAAYSFTTKSINCGFFTHKGQTVQVLDVPGTLARENKMNLIEYQADLVVKHLADVVIYIMDMTEPFPLKDQLKLYKKVKKIKPTMVFLGKEDILTEEMYEDFKDLKINIYSIDELKKIISDKAKIKKEEYIKEHGEEEPRKKKRKRYVE